MNNEFLAEKLLKEAVENIRQLGFQVMVGQRCSEFGMISEQADEKNLFIISQERADRGDY